MIAVMFSFVGRIAVITNAFIIAFTSEFIPKEGGLNFSENCVLSMKF